MPHTLIESDGQTVYITAEGAVGTPAKLAWAATGLLLLLLFLALPFWIDGPVGGSLLLWFVGFRFGAVPALQRIGRRLMAEEIRIGTHALTYQWRYAFLKPRTHTAAYQEGHLFTGAEALDKAQSRLRVSWYTEGPDPEKPVLLCRQQFPMTPEQFQSATGYVQEIFDIENSGEGYELLFSAN